MSLVKSTISTSNQSAYDMLVKEFGDVAIKSGKDIQPNKETRRTLKPPPVPRPGKYKATKRISRMKEDVPTESLQIKNSDELVTPMIEQYSEPLENVYVELSSQQSAEHTFQDSTQKSAVVRISQDSIKSFSLNEPEHFFEDSTKNANTSMLSSVIFNKALPATSLMTVVDVGEILSRLALGKYVEVFQEQMIDGPLLLDLDNDILAEFGFKKIEILRLMKFIKSGHVPIQSNEHSSA